MCTKISYIYICGKLTLLQTLSISLTIFFSVNFNFLFRLYAKYKDSFSDMANSSLEMATFTLNKMAKGGIFDHISKVSFNFLFD